MDHEYLQSDVLYYNNLYCFSFPFFSNYLDRMKKKNYGTCLFQAFLDMKALKYCLPFSLSFGKENIPIFRCLWYVAGTISNENFAATWYIMLLSKMTDLLFFLSNFTVLERYKKFSVKFGTSRDTKFKIEKVYLLKDRKIAFSFFLESGQWYVCKCEGIHTHTWLRYFS